MPSVRTFIALPASLDIQQRMAAAQSQLKSSQADVNWELPNKFHITLKFLGDVEQSNIELLSLKIASALQQFSAFEITYESLGAFPNPQNPRIVWLGIRPHRVVPELQAAIEHTCVDFGFLKEERTFHPHITMGRVKGTRNLARLTEAIKTVTFEPMQSHCSEVLLMKSDLRSSGSIYTILKSFPLQP